MRVWPWRRRLTPAIAPRRDPVVWISDQVAELTVRALRQSGSQTEAHEGIVYWAGRRADYDWFVTTCIAPAARTTYGSFEMSSLTNAKVVMFLASSGLELLGQVHSHPGGFVDHSAGDNERALMPFEGFISIIVPHYGRAGMSPLADCGVHVYEVGRFRRLAGKDVEARFRLVPGFADLRLP